MTTSNPSIPTHDFRFDNLGANRNILLNSKDEDGTIDVVLFGAHLNKGDRVLLTLNTDAGETNTAWLVQSVQQKPNDDGRQISYHAILKFETPQP